MRNTPREEACGIPVLLDPTTTRRLGHPLYSGTANRPEDQESIAAALASDRWKALFDYGMFPSWIYAFRADDPRYLAEFRNGVMFLHVFNEVSDRDHYLDNQDLMFLDTVQPVTTDVMPERAKTDYGFTTYDGRPSSAEDG